MTEFGKTPIINFKDFEDAGYDIVIYPVSTLRIAMGAVSEFLEKLKTEGDVNSTIDTMLTWDKLYDLCNYKPSKEWYYPGTKVHK